MQVVLDSNAKKIHHSLLELVFIFNSFFILKLKDKYIYI